MIDAFLHNGKLLSPLEFVVSSSYDTSYQKDERQFENILTTVSPSQVH